MKVTNLLISLSRMIQFLSRGTSLCSTDQNRDSAQLVSNENHAGFEILTAMAMKGTVFHDMTPFSLV
jgi:hypothetical protein